MAPYRFGRGNLPVGSTSRQFTTEASTSAGDTLLVVCTSNHVSHWSTAVTDSAGNVYTQDQVSNATTPTMQIYRSPGATGGSGGGATGALTSGVSTVTVTCDSATFGAVAAIAVGVPGAGALDQDATIATGSSTTPSVSATPGYADEICIAGVICSSSGGAPTINAPFTGLGSQQVTSGPYAAAGYEVLSGGSGSAQTATATITSTGWKACLWTFQPVAAATTANAGVAAAAGVAPGAGASAPAVFPSTLRCSGQQIVDENGYDLPFLAGFCVPLYGSAAPFSQAEFNGMYDKGARIIRLMVYWEYIEPTAGNIDTSWVTSHLDVGIRRALSAGLYVWLGFYFGPGGKHMPAWAQTISPPSAEGNFVLNGQNVTQYLANRYGNPADPQGFWAASSITGQTPGVYLPGVIGMGHNEPTPDASNNWSSNPSGWVANLLEQQAQMATWMRVYAPDWIAFLAAPFANGALIHDAPNSGHTSGSNHQTFTNASASPGGIDNFVIDAHWYFWATNQPGNPDWDGRQTDGRNGDSLTDTPPGPVIQRADSAAYPPVVSGTPLTHDQIMRMNAAWAATYVAYCAPSYANCPLFIGENGWNPTICLDSGAAAHAANFYAQMQAAGAIGFTQWDYGSSQSNDGMSAHPTSGGTAGLDPVTGWQYWTIDFFALLASDVTASAGAAAATGAVTGGTVTITSPGTAYPGAAAATGLAGGPDFNYAPAGPITAAGAVNGATVTVTTAGQAPAGVAGAAGAASHGNAIALGEPVSRTDSLIIDGLIELLNGGVPSVHPVCPGATFVLTPGFSRGAPQPVTQVVSSLLLDGERPTGRRTSNRTISLPIVIYGTSRANLNGARELLMQIVDQDTWHLQWTPDPQNTTALPLIFDCFRATSVDISYDQDLEDELASRLTVTFPALPFGRSADLTTLSFPSPAVGWPSPPDPEKIDDYSTVSSSTQAGWWSQSTRHLADSYSAHWDLSASDGDSPAIYTRTLAAPLDITNLTKLTFWFGMGTTTYRHWHRGNITFAITLNDNSGHSLALGGGAYVSASNDPEWPNWNQITFAIPTSSTFDYTHLSSYSIKAWRFVDCDGDYRLNGDAYLNGLTAVAAAVPSYAQVRGTVYQIGAPGGTARTPMAAQFQAIPKTDLVPQTWSTAGDYTFTPPAGCTSLKVRVKGATGKGGDRTSAGAGGGAGGGAGCAHDTYPCTPGQPISLHVGAAGTSGGYPTLVNSYWVHNDGWNTTTLVTPSFTPGPNEILVVKALNSDRAQAFGTPTGGGLVWTSRVNQNITGHTRNAIWTASSGATPGPMTVSLSASSSQQNHAMLVERWANAKLDATPSVINTTGTGAPSASITTEANNSIITWVDGDWNVNNATRTYRGSPTEQQYWAAGDCTGYFAYQTQATAGAVTVGLTAPSQTWTIAAIEIQAFAAGALTNGEASTFDGQAFIAAGGTSVAVNTPGGGAGGTAAASTVPAGGTKYRGGNGYTASTTGGGAGSSAGDDAQGADAAGQAGATAPTGGISGGGGGNAGGNNGGTVPGGGAFSTGGNASGANGADGKIQIWYTPPLTAFKTLIVHSPGYDAPPTLAPLVPVGAGLDPPDGREYQIDSPIAGLNARYYGTYTIIAVLSVVNSPASSRTITATFTQYDYPGGPSVTTAVARTLTPSSESPPIANGVVILGEATLPIRDIADDQTAAYFTAKVNSTNSSDRVLDLLVLDVRGQLTVVNVASGSGFVNFYLDEPDVNRDWGRVLGSSYERSQAVSVLDSVLALTGGPLVIDPNGPGWLLAYSPDAGAPALTASFWSRWRDSRLA